jgi:DNA polymerase-3 subunit beta
MNIVCNGKDLATAVAAVSRVVDKNNVMPILLNIELTAAGETLHIRGTDLRTSLERVISVEVNEAGSVTVPAKLFASYLANVKDSLLTISATDTRISINPGDGSKYDFHALPAAEYPKVPPRASDTTGVEIPGDALRKAIKAVSFAAATEDSRGVIVGTRLRVYPSGAFELTATNGYLLAQAQHGEERDEATAWSAVLDTPALGEVGRNIDGLGKVTVSRAAAGGSENVRFLAESLDISTRVIEGQFPDVRHVFPVNFEAKLTVDRTAIRQAVKRAELVSADRASQINLHGTSTSIVITAASDVVGKAREEVDAEMDGDEFDISMNAAYLGSVLDHLDTESVTFAFTATERPLTVTPTGGAGAIYLVMPLRQPAAAAAA